MSLENISQPIRTQSLEEHQDLLQEKFAEFRLEYADRILKRQIPFPEETTISIEGETISSKLDPKFIISRYADIAGWITAYERDQEKGEWDSLYEQNLNKIIDFYNTDPATWKQKAMDWLLEEKKKAKEYKILHPENTSENNQELSFDSGTIGNIRFFVDDVSEDSPAEFQQYGSVMQLHLDPLYETKYGNNESISFSESMSKIATSIVDRFPQVSVISGESWLLDTKLAKAIGFQNIKEESFASGPKFWWQFLNKDGTLNKEKVEQLLKTGIPPHKVVKGIIPVMDFLKKYLPADRRGEILLKERNPSFNWELFEKERAALRKLYRNWDAINATDYEIELNKNTYLASLLEEAGVKDLFVKHIYKLKEEGKTLADLEKDPIWDGYMKTFFNYIKEKKFIDKKVSIE